MRIIGGEARGRKIEAPAGRNTRPTLDRVRENLFNMIQADVAGSRVLDLFAGSGALSLEALSRGAESAVMADIDRRATEVQRRNIEALGYRSRTDVRTCDWYRTLQDLQNEHACFDLVFLDPPYAMNDLTEVFRNLIPLVTADSIVILEHEAKREVNIGQGFECIKDRTWGFCGIRICRLNSES